MHSGSGSEIRTADLQIGQSGHALQGVRSVRQEHGIGFIHRRHRKRGQYKAVVVDDREDFLALLVFVAAIADAVPAFLRDGVGAIAMQDAEIEVILLRQMPYAGDERLIERAIIGLFGDHFVDGHVVDCGGPVACLGYRQALPLHTRIEHPQDQVEDAVITQFAFRPAFGHREVREDKCDELRLGELNRNRCCGGAFCHLAHTEVAS